MKLPARLLEVKENAVLHCLSKNVTTPKRIIDSGVLSHIEFHSEHSSINPFVGIFDGSKIIIMEPDIAEFRTLQSMMRAFTQDSVVISNAPSYIILDFADYRVSMQGFSNEVKVCWTREG